MAPRKNSAPRVSAAETAAVVVAPRAPRAKRSRTSSVEAVAESAKEEANNYTHGEIVGRDTHWIEASLPNDLQAGTLQSTASSVTRAAYEVIQKEPADLCQVMLSL